MQQPLPVGKDATVTASVGLPPATEKRSSDCIATENDTSTAEKRQRFDWNWVSALLGSSRFSVVEKLVKCCARAIPPCVVLLQAIVVFKL